jgi:hypothetical protein
MTLLIAKPHAPAMEAVHRFLVPKAILVVLLTRLSHTLQLLEPLNK